MDNVKLVTMASTFRGLGFSSIWIYSSIYMNSFLKLPTIFISVVFLVGGLFSSISQYAGGRLGDLVGHKPVYNLFMFLSFLASLFYSISPVITGSQFYYSIILGIIMIMNGLQSPSSNALVSQSSQVQLKGFSILRVGNNLGWGFGPAIGGFILSFLGFQYLFYFFTIFSLLSFLITLFVSRIEAKPTVKQINFRTSNVALIILSFSAMFLFMVQAQETISLSIYSNEIFSGTYYNIGIIYMINGLLVVITQPIFYKLAKRTGEYISLTLGGLIYTLGFMTYGLDSNLWQMIISTAILTFGENMAFPTGYSIIAEISRKERIGTNIGIYNAFISIGRATGPLLGGYFLPLVSNHLLLWTLVTIPGFAATIILILSIRVIEDYRHRFNSPVS